MHLHAAVFFHLDHGLLNHLNHDHRPDHDSAHTDWLGLDLGWQCLIHKFHYQQNPTQCMEGQ